jgi:hypothetical protein
MGYRCMVCSCRVCTGHQLVVIKLTVVGYVVGKNKEVGNVRHATCCYLGLILRLYSNHIQTPYNKLVGVLTTLLSQE